MNTFKMTRWEVCAAWFVLVLLLISASGCGGGGGSSATPPPVVVNASPGGIWEGVLSGASSQHVFGLTTESGELHFVDDAGLQYIGTVSVAGTSVTASFTGITSFGKTFPDGSTTGTGTLTGTVTERYRVDGSYTFTTANGTVTNDAFWLLYSGTTSEDIALYDDGSSLATIMGNYQDNRSDLAPVLSIDGNGTLFSQDPITGCVVNGAVSIIDMRYNAYRIQYTIDGCTRPGYAYLNGTFTGHAVLTIRQLQIVIMAISDGADKFARLQVLDRR